MQRLAALNAIERFASEGGEASLLAFERVRDSIGARFSEIVLEVLELSRNVDPASRQLSMTVRVDISEAKLRNLMQATSAVGAGGGQKSMMGMFMLAREQAAVEQFGPERRASSEAALAVTSAKSTDSLRKVKESESLRGSTVVLDDRVKAVDSLSASSSARATSVERNSSVLRADKIEYVVAPAQDLDAVLGGRLTQAGYETIEAAFLEDDLTPALLDLVRADFGTGDDLKASTLRRMLAAAQKAEVRYALVGTVDIGMGGTDEISGSQRVYAKVSAKVYDLSGRLPRTIANVGPAQFAGLGPDASVAKVNALKNAGEAIARAVLDNLSNKQVR